MLIIVILVGLVAGVLLAVFSPKLWAKLTTRASQELNKPTPP